MRAFFDSLFIWWRGHSIGTYIFTWRNGIYVGSDNLGNRYFKSKKDERRWVLYHKDCDASSISPSWHGWIHGKGKKLPISENDALVTSSNGFFYKNMTGTIDAYHPKRYTSEEIVEYVPWKPKN